MHITAVHEIMSRKLDSIKQQGVITEIQGKAGNPQSTRFRPHLLNKKGPSSYFVRSVEIDLFFNFSSMTGLRKTERELETFAAPDI
jgi:hypothetical protein